MRVPGLRGSSTRTRAATTASLVWALLFGLAWLVPRHWPTPMDSLEVSDRAPDAIPELELSILVRDFLLIKQLRDRALEDNFLFRSPNDMVAGIVQSEGRAEKVKVRLKGDFVDHFDSERWSWRVHVSGGGQVLGLRRFSFQAPSTRFYHWEQLFFQRLREEGLLAPRYEFVRLRVNTEDRGLMALEEHFSKELLEAQGRRDGVIIRFDEDEFWRERARSYPGADAAHPFPPRQAYNWQVAPLRPFREPEIARSPISMRHATLARGLLRALQVGTLAPAQIFDVQLMGRFLALHELFGFWHGLRWHNMRFYLNPITLKLEPIAFDATSYSKGVSGFIFGKPALLFAGRVVSDPEIYAAYRAELDRLLEKTAVRKLVNELADAEATILQTLQREGENAAPLAPRMRQRIPILRSGLAMKHAKPPRRVLTRREIAGSRMTGREGPPPEPGKGYAGVVYADVVERPDGRQQIELLTSSREDAFVRDLQIAQIKQIKQIAGPSEIESILAAAGLKLPIRLPGNNLDVTPQRVVFALPPSLRIDPLDLTGVAQLASHGSREFPFEGRANVLALTAPPLREEAQLSELLAQHPFLAWEAGSFVIGPGAFRVTAPLIIPKRLYLPNGSTVESPGLRLQAGTRLSFARDSYLHVWGALEGIGSPSEPIELHGVANQAWLGVVVFGEAAHSRLEHTRIRGATSTSLGPWQLSGGITFYRSRVTLNDVRIENSRAEDALNLIHCEFALHRVVVVSARSDGLDSDFSQGTLADCRFDDIAGDAIDLSGSQLEASALHISRVGDKAVSVGERSHFASRGLRLESVAVGVVSKDGSHALLVETVARDVSYAALMSYRKKPEYGPGHLESTGLDFDDSARLAIAQRGSELRIDGSLMAVSELDVDHLYRVGFMRRHK